MKILAPVFILLTLLSACIVQPQPTPAMGYPMGMEMNEGGERGERGEAGERH